MFQDGGQYDHDNDDDNYEDDYDDDDNDVDDDGGIQVPQRPDDKF